MASFCIDCINASCDRRGTTHIKENCKEFAHIVTIKDSGQRTEFPSGAVRDMAEGKGRMDLLPAHGLLRLSQLFEQGAQKYGERNWEKGIPIASFIDSGLRHIMKYMAGIEDEDHLVSAAWNLLCAVDTRERLGWEFERGDS